MRAARAAGLVHVALTCGVLAACGPADAPADAPPPVEAAAPVDPGLLEVRGYVLTEPALDRYFAASHRIVAAMAALPPGELDRVAAVLNPDEPAADAADASLDEFAARLAGDAVIRQALEAAGVAPREYAVLTLALLEAGMAQQWIDARPASDADSLARGLGLDPRNVAFMRAHAAEIQRRQAALEAELPEALHEE
jgi:hypothetical protein